MKKVISTASILVVIILMALVSCTPQQVPAVDVSATPTVVKTAAITATTATPIPAEPDIEVDLSKLEGLQIRFMHPWTGETLELLHRMVDQFNQTNEWGIHVIMSAPGSAAQVTAKINEELSNNIASNVLVAPVSQLLALDEKHGLVVDLSPYAGSASFAMDSSLVDDFNPTFWDEGQLGEKLYGIPAQKSALLMVFNNSWGKALGFNGAPVSVEAFRQQVCAANALFRKDEDTANDGLGGWVINSDSASVYNWLLAFGADPFSAGDFAFSTPAAQEAFTYLYDLKANACAFVNRSSTDAECFALREALVYSLWLQDLDRQVEAMTRAASEDAWTLMPYPMMDAETLLTNGSFYSVLHQDEASDLAAWLFIRWLSQPEQQARLLVTQGTLPLGRAVMAQMGDYASAHPYWQQTVGTFTRFITPPADADWQVVAPLLEDAAWQLWISGINAEGIPDVLAQMDDLALELSERYP